MKKHTTLLGVICFVLIVSSFSGCDPNSHNPSDHPCNFPDLDTELGLRTPFPYKIIDKTTLLSLVDTTKDAIIHRDSVKLFDANFEEISSSYNNSGYCPDWEFNNLLLYKDVSYTDPQELLDLQERTFYLQTAFDDIDTIHVTFEQCLTISILFNGLDTYRPINDPAECSSSLYFKK